MTATAVSRLAFHLPPQLEASEPPEARGQARDTVRMLVARRGRRQLTHTTFSALPELLDAGDLVVVNTSATIAAALDARDPAGEPVVVHLSTQGDDGRWVVELRRPVDGTSRRWSGPPPGPVLTLAGGAVVTRHEPAGPGARLWLADLAVPGPLPDYLAAHGRPIRYHYVEHPWPLAAYQNVYAVEPGSAEMASAGRPFTAEVLTRLMALGVGVAPVVLHTGVASLEADETPYAERFRVPVATADQVTATRRRGGRIVAVGTTTVRALETAADGDGGVRAAAGWTDLVITPERGLAVVDAMLTGWHEPEASHLMMLEAVAGRDLLERSYRAALASGYRWHEFGDVHLILP